MNALYGVQSTHLNMFLKQTNIISILADFPACIAWELKLPWDSSLSSIGENICGGELLCGFNAYEDESGLFVFARMKRCQHW